MNALYSNSRNCCVKCIHATMLPDLQASALDLMEIGCLERGLQYRLTTRTILKHTDGSHVNCNATFVNYGNNSTRFYACHEEYIGNGLNLLTKFIFEDVMKCKLITFMLPGG